MSGHRNHRSGGHQRRSEDAPKNNTPEQLAAINATLRDFMTQQEERLHAPPDRAVKWKLPIEVATVFAVAIYTLITLGIYLTALSTEGYQLRAYLHPIIDRKPVDLTKTPLEWSYTLTNYGSTPACHVRTSGQLYVGPAAFALGTRPPTEDMHFWGIEPKFCVAPHEEHEVKLGLAYRSKTLDATEKALIEKGETVYLYAHGTIFYDDIFGTPHATYFRISLDLSTGKMDWTPEGNFTDDNPKSVWRRFRDLFSF